MSAEPEPRSNSISEINRLEKYHRIKKIGEIPTPTSVSGAFIGILASSAACSAVGAESNILATLAVAAASSVAGHIYDRRRYRRELAQFMAQQTSSSNDVK